MNKEVLRKEGETDFEHKLRLSLMKLHKETDLDWIEIVEILGIDCHYDTLRRMAYGMKETHDYYQEKIKNGAESRELLEEIEKKTLELQKERIKRSTVNIEHNKNLRNLSRIEMWEDKIRDAIGSLDPMTPPPILIKDEEKENIKTGITGIADPHFGKEFIIHGLNGEILNEYNEKVFEDRMWSFRDELVKIVQKENLSSLEFFFLGDLLEGILRQSILKNLEYGIVDSTMRLCEFLSIWLNDLSKYVYLNVHFTTGNHSEIRPLNSKSFDFPHENMERIIAFYLRGRLDNNENIKINDAKIATLVNCMGLNIFATHGQNEKSLEQSIKDYSFMYNVPIDIMITGHYHSLHGKSVGFNTEMQNIEYIQFPSIIGIDDYSVKLKKIAPAGSILIVLDDSTKNRIKYEINLQK